MALDMFQAYQTHLDMDQLSILSSSFWHASRERQEQSALATTSRPIAKRLSENTSELCHNRHIPANMVFHCFTEKIKKGFGAMSVRAFCLSSVNAEHHFSKVNHY